MRPLSRHQQSEPGAVAKVLNDIEKGALFVHVAREDMVNFVDHQHLQADVPKQFYGLELLPVYTIIGFKRSK